MWDEGFYIAMAGLVVIAALLSFKFWGTGVYQIGKHWRLASFIIIGCLLGALLVQKQHDLKYELAYYYFTGTKNTGTMEARFQIRQCKEFIQAKLDGQPVENDRYITAGFFNISSISNWEFCARTFGLNYWKHDTSIDGQDGGRLLCEAYARDTYRSSRVQTWCDTVFTPAPTSQAQKI